MTCVSWLDIFLPEGFGYLQTITHLGSTGLQTAPARQPTHSRKETHGGIGIQKKETVFSGMRGTGGFTEETHLS